MRVGLVVCLIALAGLVAAAFWHYAPERADRSVGDAPAPDTPDGPAPEPATPTRDPLRARVTGNVIDEDGRAIAGAAVRLAGGDPTTSDTDGAFALEAAPGAPPTLEVVANGYAPYRHTFARRDGILIVLERGAPVRVRVVDASTNAPLPGVAVRLQRGGAWLAETSGADGVATFPCVPARARRQQDPVEVLVQHAGYALHHTRHAEPRDVPDIRLAPAPPAHGVVRHKVSGTPVAGATVRFVVKRGPFELATATTGADGTFTLPAAPPEAKYWTAEHETLAADPVKIGDPILMFEPSTASGVVLAPDGKPVADATVYAWHGQGARTKTDAEGRFRVRWDEFFIAAHADYTRSAEVKAAEDGMVLRLEPAAEVTGRYMDGNGRPVPGVVVTINPARRRTVTDGRGRFTLRTQKGMVMLTTMHPVMLARWTRVAVEGDQDLGDIKLQRGGTIKGIVVDGDGRPVPGAVIGTALSGKDGRFVLRPLPPGPQKLRAWRAGMYGRMVRSGTGATDVRLVLVPAGVVRARVTAGGAPVAGVRVEAAGLHPPATTDAEGRFVFLLVPPDEPLIITLLHDDHPEKTVELRPGEKLREIRLDG